MATLEKNAITDKYKLSLIKDVGDCLTIPYKEVTSGHSAFRSYVSIKSKEMCISLSVRKDDKKKCFKVIRTN